MFERILFPTDGSPLSERVVPLVETLARAQDAEVIITRVVEPLPYFGYEATGFVSAESYQDMVDIVDEDARRHLDGLVSRFQAAGVRARGELLHGTPGIALLDYEAAARPDLVIMSTHGRTGLARFALGSIADRMVREGTTPVLFARPFSLAESTFEAALVPLDGSPIAEEALALVTALAGKPLHRVQLLRAIARPEDRPDAIAYLHGVAQEMRSVQLKVHMEVEVGEPHEVIEQAAANVDFVILSTHGRGGLDRLRHGSVADAATRHLDVPTLLVRSGMQPAAPRPESVASATTA